MNINRLKSFKVEKFAEKGEHFYYTKMKEWLKAGLKGKFAAIDPETGEIYIGGTILEVLHKAHQVHTDKVYHIVKIGYKTSAALK